MTVWGRARCDRCSAEIGLAHPIFSVTQREGLRWDPFVGCPICGALLCQACAAASTCCPACDEAWLIDTYPPVWLNEHRITLRPLASCRACGVKTRAGFDRPDPAREEEQARWYACLECAAELCEPCALERSLRCACRAEVVLRGVPPWSAYLPAPLREQLRTLPQQEQAAVLRARHAELRAEWERGTCTELEARSRTSVLDHCLRALGIEPQPLEIAPEPDRE